MKLTYGLIQDDFLLGKFLEGRSGELKIEGKRVSFSPFAIIVHPYSFETVIYGFDPIGEEKSITIRKFVGGDAFLGETIQQALMREIHEETLFDPAHIGDYLEKLQDQDQRKELVTGYLVPSKNPQVSDIHAVLFFFISAPREWCEQKPELETTHDKYERREIRWVNPFDEFSLSIPKNRRMFLFSSHAPGGLLLANGILREMSRRGEDIPDSFDIWKKAIALQSTFATIQNVFLHKKFQILYPKARRPDLNEKRIRGKPARH